MYFSTKTLFTFALLTFQHVIVNADAEYERTKELLARFGGFDSPIDMHLRVRREDLSFCYGSNSICAIGNDLFDACDAYFDDYIQWYVCLCGNGYVAVNQACYWCQLAYKLDISYAGNANTEGCSSASVTIAPIPSSVLSVQSHYNATYTGIISGAGAANTDSPPASASTTDSQTLTGSSDPSSRTATGGVGIPLGGAKTTSSRISRTDSGPSKSTPFGGVTSIVTVTGGGSGSPQTADPQAGSPTTTNSLRSGGGSVPGDASGLDIPFAIMFSIVSFFLGLSALYLV